MNWREYVDKVPEFGKRVEKMLGRSIPETLLNEEIRIPMIRHYIADDVFGSLVDLDADQMGCVTVSDSEIGDRIWSFSLMAGSYADIEFQRLEEANRSGFFRRYDAQRRATVATDLQHAVDHALRELRVIQSRLGDMDQAPARLMATLSPLLRRQVGRVELSRFDVVYLAGLHNAVHNAFVRLVSLLGALQGTVGSPLPKDEDLRPNSPYPGMDEAVARERATPEEILQWAREGLLEAAAGN
jgi:hypothetical protein